jgi:Raf kinase inhibitor-like YbhB/YbcL family protein
VVAFVALAGCGTDGHNRAAVTTQPSRTTAAPAPSFVLRSSAFRDGQPIPKRYTCDGPGTPPPLSWSGAPAATKSFALIVDDPDAPGGTFVHWVAWFTASSTSGSVPANVVDGRNGAGGDRYTGPCPPSGVHHYGFRLYALRDTPPVQPGADAATLRAAIADIRLAATMLTGTYRRGG